MAMLFTLAQSTRRILMPAASPETKKKLRTLGMTFLTWKPYVAFQRNQLCRGQSDLTANDKDIVGRVDCSISVADTMYEGDVRKYLRVGLSGLRAIEKALETCHPREMRAILDLPSGCGRVGRYLAARYPQAKITACDLATDMVDFCSRKLGMTPAYSKTDMQNLNFPGKFDLIWCGSLVTHLNAEDISELFRLFDRHLSDGGVAVFTAHGNFVAERLKQGDHYGVGPEAARKAVEKYEATGFAFTPYLGSPETAQYGHSLTSVEWIRSRCAQVGDWKEASFQPQGWDNHQDVYACVKQQKSK